MSKIIVLLFASLAMVSQVRGQGPVRDFLRNRSDRNGGDSHDNRTNIFGDCDGRGRGRGSGVFGNATRVDNDCIADIADPICAYNKAGDEGTWVCRTFFDPVSGAEDTFSACTSPDTRLDTDECGCCGEGCAALCSCPCELENGEGAGVLVMRYDFDDEESGEVCVTQEKADLMIVKSPFATCGVCDP